MSIDKDQRNAAASPAEFEDAVYRQLLQIFGSVDRDLQLNASAHRAGIHVDMAARSRDGRLLVFEVKYSESRKLSPSSYMPILSLKNLLESAYSGEFPVLIVVSNVPVDEHTEATFAKAGIPVITLGNSVSVTTQRLRSAFHNLAITVSDISDGTGSTRAIRGRCFVSLSQRAQAQQVFALAIKPAAEVAGYEILTALHGSHMILADALEASSVYIADLSWGEPSLYFEAGMAHSMKREIILLTQDKPVMIPELTSKRVIPYEGTIDGIQRLKTMLTEALVASQNRRHR